LYDEVTKFDPVMSTAVPPETGPEAGAIEEITGSSLEVAQVV
jgi:hypothetical protein